MDMDNQTTLSPLSNERNFTMVENSLYYLGQVIVGSLMLFSLFTNIIVMYIFVSKKFGKKTIIKYLYANISLSDELFIIASLIQITIYGQSCHSNCRAFLGYSITISGFVSTYSMALIAFKRYQGIAFPIQSQTKTSKLSVFVVIAIIWIFSVATPLIFIRFEKVTEYDGTLFLKTCTMITYTVMSLNSYPYFNLLGMVVIPLLIGLIFSLKAIQNLVCSKTVDIVRQKKLMERKLRASFMIAIVIVTFAVCWLPITSLFFINNLNYSSMKFCDYNYNAYFILTILLMLEFWINPVIYWYMNTDFRSGINHILKQTKTKLKWKCCCFEDLIGTNTTNTSNTTNTLKY